MSTLETWTTKSDMKVCFVTTGATAPFTGLIKSVLQPSSLNALSKEGYTHLLIQYGSAKEVYTNSANAANTYLEKVGKEMIIDGMDFNSQGLQEQFKLVQQTSGLAISHAGMHASVNTSQVLSDG
jgi:beta-1,4-N-acetylglucosaminyltransferase